MMLLLVLPLLLFLPIIVFCVNLELLRRKSRLSREWCLVLAFLTGICATGAEHLFLLDLLSLLKWELNILIMAVVPMSGALVVLVSLMGLIDCLIRRNGPPR